MTGNGNYVNLPKFLIKTREIASSERISGKFYRLGTSVLSTAVAVASIEQQSAEDVVWMSEQSRAFRGLRGHKRK